MNTRDMSYKHDKYEERRGESVSASVNGDKRKCEVGRGRGAQGPEDKHGF